MRCVQHTSKILLLPVCMRITLVTARCTKGLQVCTSPAVTFGVVVVCLRLYVCTALVLASLLRHVSPNLLGMPRSAIKGGYEAHQVWLNAMHVVVLACLFKAVFSMRHSK